MDMMLTLQPLGVPAASNFAGGGAETRAQRLAHAFPNVVLRLGSRIVRASAKALPTEDELCREKASLL
jgi:hypothetical protein